MTFSGRAAAPPDVPRNPSDTIVVTGGRGVASVDAGEVRLAAARVSDAADSLRRAAALCGSAWAVLAVAAVAPGPAAFGAGTNGPGSGAGEAGRQAHSAGTEAAALCSRGVGAATVAGSGVDIGPETVARCRALSGSVEAVTSGLLERADTCALLGWRLLRAAGLYEEAEGLVERVVGGLVTAEGFVIGTALGVPPVVRLLGGVYRAMGVTAAGSDPTAAARRSPAEPEGVPGRQAEAHFRGVGRRRTAGGFGDDVVRGVAPWTDELAYGFGHGVARSAGARPGIPGAAGVLADAARGPFGDALGRSARVERVGRDDFAGAVPAWHDRGAGTLDEALTRVDDLYPRRGAPEATVAVQRVTGEGGVTSWTVLVPGTQSVPPAVHPWDGLTDLELVAEHPDQATQAVEAAMSDAGIGPDEPVVLVGHSLGGIAVTALASRPAFAERYRIGGVLTAGAPVATFRTPPGVPVLHLETAEEVVSSVDGRSSTESPRAPDRVTVGRTLADSTAEVDRAASGDTSRAHSIPTHARTLALARASGDPRVAAVVERIEPLLRGDSAEATFYRAERVAPTSPEPSPSPGPTPGPSPSPGPSPRPGRLP
ncbi:hypothetical protein [Myceligenerans pegani]|uniref:Uncharacterized protein n=1 Tax=Myceligenerans pegani TaxID=2776917 RepID=A0ABR9MTR5_9MICO|nr:hypothetical protein [Myceligenerans sp. TRM 65318]MBE1874147.1 hypothetical protein [Myceligenerans sp. TRM 65318]MBE3016419.1 hypothetical protein [Myceligenerans sp. TRM 65318]